MADRLLLQYVVDGEAAALIQSRAGLFLMVESGSERAYVEMTPELARWLEEAAARSRAETSTDRIYP